MIPGIIMAAAGLAIFCLRAGRKQPPLAHSDLVRLSLYSERVRREELFPFVE